MSQATLLEQVAQWSPETCRQELPAVLPKLLSVHHKTDSWEEHINVLQMIIGMFLPHLPLSELEEECFSKVLPKVVVMFTSLLEEISKQIGGLSSQNTELQAFLRNILQIMVQTLEALSACMRHVCSYEESVSIDSIRTLPSCVLHVLKDTFQHCKDSEALYSGRLSLVGDLLQALFKEAYSLQKSLMELLEKVNMEHSHSNEEMFDVVTVLHNLLDICSVISSLDIALHANTWKFIIKQSVKYQSLVEERLRHSDITSSLSSDLLASLCSALELAKQIQHAGLQVSVQCPEYKLFQKTTKMCRFFTNTLVHYIKEFKPFLSKSCRHFYQLYLQILSKFPPSLSAPSVPPNLREELNSAVLVPMDAMLSQLLPMRPFAECVLTTSQERSAELPLSQCLLLVSVMEKLSFQPEEVLSIWCDGSQFSEETPRLSLFEAVFLSFRRCPLERAVPVRLPGVMVHGQAQVMVSLHQHVCVYLCGFVASLPAQHFPPLERSLLGAVLQSDTLTAFLATDVWCFLARYGTAELCLHHVLLTAHLIKSCPSEGYQLTHLGVLLRRLLFLMTPNHQMEFVRRFTPSQEDNLRVLHPTLLRSLCSEARTCLERDVLAAASAALDAWHDTGYKLGSVHQLNKVLAVLLMVVKEESLQAECTASALRIIQQLWSRMCSSQVQLHPSLQCTMRLLLSVSAVLIKSIEPHALVQVFRCLSGLDVQKCPHDLILAALEFLASVGNVFIPSEIQSQVLPGLAALFSSLLSLENWLLHQHALEAFAIFAEVTNHEEVISQCLKSEETKNKVVNFLSKIISGQEGEDARIERLRAEARVIEKHDERLEREEETPLHTHAAEEPCAKRPRQETCREEEYERYLQTAESALKALQGVMSADPPSSPPPWLTDRLRALQTLITQISDSASQKQ